MNLKNILEVQLSTLGAQGDENSIIMLRLYALGNREDGNGNGRSRSIGGRTNLVGAGRTSYLINRKCSGFLI